MSPKRPAEVPPNEVPPEAHAGSETHAGSEAEPDRTTSADTATELPRQPDTVEPQPQPDALHRARLSLGDPPAPLLPGDTFAAAGCKAMWPHVDRLLAREAQLSDPEQVDGLKRYRVATRRLRAALRVFREAYSARATRGIRRELSRLADAVGEVRDLDVRTVALNDWAAAREPVLTAEVEPLRAAWIDRRGAASDALLRHVTTRHHARLRAELVAFVTSAERYAVVDDDGPARTIRDRAGSETWAAFERVRVYATVVRWADLATLHQLRIEAKRLRYTIEFLGPLLGPEQARLLELLVQLQDHLGALNDAAIASDATRAFLAERHASLGPDERAAIETYLADREAAVRQLRRGVPRAWRPIASSAFARHLARAIAGPRETPARSRHPAAATANAAATAVPAASS